MYCLSNRYLYIESYKGLSNNEPTSKFKALGKKIMKRYEKYLHSYNNSTH